jgi:hypothetical protein
MVQLDPNTLIAIYAAVVSTILLLIKVAEYASARPDLRLSMSRAATIGDFLPVNDILQVIAANQGGSRIGVASLSLSTVRNMSIPLIHHLPIEGAMSVPAILEPHERASMWLDYKDLQQVMREHDDGIVAIVATLNDGSTFRQDASKEWRSFHEPKRRKGSTDDDRRT